MTAVDSSPMQPSYYSTLDRWLLAITPPILRLYPYDSLINSIAKQIAITEKAQAYAVETLRSYSKAEIADEFNQILGEFLSGLKSQEYYACR